MLQVKDLHNHQITGKKSYNNNEIEFELLLLAMLTAFNLELTETQIYKNMRSLFIQLDLPVKKSLTLKVQFSLSILLQDNLILRQKSGYIISEKGEPLGIRVLEHFRQIFKN
ncbi:MAG: hypothetical protein JSU57_04120 [Candidatus Heimdallarchaeota archaeon]|nr:MAG: hypothetical protein JSU57_04120 [Candidatus Heimdallarchaeota archaeon]